MLYLWAVKIYIWYVKVGLNRDIKRWLQSKKNIAVQVCFGKAGIFIRERIYSSTQTHILKARDNWHN